MSNHQDHSRELTRVMAELNTAACALNTLSRLLTHSVDWERHDRLEHEEFTYGLSGLLRGLAKEVETNSCRISKLNDRLPGGGS